MIADLRILFDDELTDGEVPIFDMNHVTLRHLTKFSLPLLKKYMVYTQVFDLFFLFLYSAKQFTRNIGSTALYYLLI